MQEQVAHRGNFLLTGTFPRSCRDFDELRIDLSNRARVAAGLTGACVGGSPPRCQQLLSHHPEIALLPVLLPHLIGRPPGGLRNGLRNASFIYAQVRRGEGWSEAPLKQVGQDLRILRSALEEAG